MPETPGFLTYVFIERIAPNAALLHPHPQEHATQVSELCVSLGWATSVVGPEKPERGGVLFFSQDAFPDSLLGELASVLLSHGIGAYAYELIDVVTDEGDTTLVFTRCGDSHPQDGCQVVLVHTYLTDQDARTWVWGASGDLAHVSKIVTEALSDCRIFPVHAEDGIAAVEVIHPAPRNEGGSVGDSARDLIDVLTLSGFEGPILLSDHRDDSGLTASY
ncbi:MAG: hypothetical protein CSA82_03780 [Actinobacteria bacterium]|nr:MAG: hypothetical protein CSA82_03780 [Actinomycetota bacterium]